MACCGRQRRTSSPSTPILIGEPNGVVLRARATIGIAGLPVGETAWFTGTTVAALVSQGVLVSVD